MSDLTKNLVDSTKPFRIFVSLLDRWEVGYPLSIALVYDALTIAMTVDQAETGDKTIHDNVSQLLAKAHSVTPYAHAKLQPIGQNCS
jgi:hypothetical protein